MNPEKPTETESKPVEKKETGEYLKKFSIARKLIKASLEQPGVEKDASEREYLQGIEIDLDFGNEMRALESLEIGCFRLNKEKINLWRKAVLEISKESKPLQYWLSQEEVGKALYEEFAKKQEALNLEADRYHYDKVEIKENDQYALRFHDAANEVLYGNHENATILLEEEIDRLIEFDHGLRQAQEDHLRSRKVDVDRLNDNREQIAANYKKIIHYRRMRDSLYAISQIK